MSATLLRRFYQCSAIVLTMSGQAMGTLWSRVRFTHGGHSGVTLTPVLSSVGMFLPRLFQGISPVCHSCSWRILLPS